ncbi:MAG TPA: zinc ribbon domain-containing protein [Candidatus Limnocylindrales bacterium]
MPTYDYICSTCGHRFEVVHGVNDAGPERCPRCGATTLRKAFSPPTIHFKGSGWAKKERNSAATRKAATSAGDDPPKAAESKPAAEAGDKAGSGSGGKTSTATPAPKAAPADGGGGTKTSGSAAAD